MVLGIHYIQSNEEYAILLLLLVAVLRCNYSLPWPQKGLPIGGTIYKLTGVAVDRAGQQSVTVVPSFSSDHALRVDFSAPCLCNRTDA